MDSEDDDKDKKKSEKEKDKDATQRDLERKWGKTDKLKSKGSKISEVRFAVSKKDPNEENVDHPKPSTSKGGSNASQIEQTEEYQVNQWLEKILKSTDDLRTSHSSAMTLPERGKGSRFSDFHDKRTTMYTGSTDSAAIRRKLSIFLPSHTMNRLHKTNEFDTHKSVERQLSRHRLIRDRYSSRDSMTLLERRKSHPMPSIESVSSAEIAIDESLMYETDEDLLHHLSTVRNLTMPLKEKRKIRNSIIGKIKQPKHVESTFAQKKQKVKLDFKRFINQIISRAQIWTTTLKEVEGHFGTGVVSYFVFLRFLLLMNIIVFLHFAIFIVLPQAFGYPSGQKEVILAPNISVFDASFDKYFKGTNEKTTIEPLRPSSKMRTEEFFPEDIGVDNLGSLLDTYMFPDIVDVALYYNNKSNYTSDELINISRYCRAAYAAIVKNETSYSFIDVIQDLLQGTGWMERTILFIGYYRPEDLTLGHATYNMSVAFLFVLFSIFVVSIVLMIKFTSEGNQETLLLGSGVANYSNGVFGAWDYCIIDKKTAKLKCNSIVRELKSLLSESRRKEAIKQWTAVDKSKILGIRVLVNLIVFTLLFVSLYLIYMTAIFQMEKYQKRELASGGFHVFLIQFLCPFTIMTLYMIMVGFFPFLVKFEKYHAQTEINVNIARLLFLRLTSLIVLVSLIYYEIVCQPQNVCGLGISIQCPSPICWETFAGQQMYKLIMIDLFVYLGIFFCLEMPWNYAVKKWNNRLTALVGKETFDIPVEVLSLLYSQTLGWLGMFYSPLIPLIHVIKLVLIFYMKRHTVLKFCQPSHDAYKASRSNAIFMLVLFVVFFFVLFVLCYSISNLPPSPGCSPFGIYVEMRDAITEAMVGRSTTIAGFLHFIFSGVFYIPAGILLCLVIYYYVTIGIGYKRMVNLLKTQMVLEGRDKEFLLNRIAEAAIQSST